MDPNSSAVVAEVIAKLQGLLGQGGSAPSGPKEALIPPFDTAFALCQQKAKTLSPEIQKLTGIYQSAAKTMKLILGYSSSSKKFSSAQQQKLKQKFMSLSKDTEDLEKQQADYIDHCRALRELLSTTFWVFVPTPEYLLKGAIESADFCALKFQKRKNLDHNQWYKLLQVAVKNLQKFVLENNPTGLSFNFNGSDNWNQLIDGTAPSAPQAKKQQPKETQSKGPAVQAKKAKKKQMVGQTFTITNYENENIDFQPEELQMKHAVYLQNSKGVVITIDSKFKSIAITKCEKIIVKIKNCVSGVEIIGCKDVTVIVSERTPSISVDTSQVVKVILNQKNLECDIVSSKASELTVSYEKIDGHESKAFLVGEQLITKWNSKNGKFQTAIYDKFL